MDLDPFVPVGITRRPCASSTSSCCTACSADSPPDTPRGDRRAGAQQAPHGAQRGREPGLQARARARQHRAGRMGRRAARRVRADRRRLDAALSGTAYRDALRAAQSAWRTPQQLPSARVLDALGRSGGCAYTAFVLEHSQRAQQQLLALPWSPNSRRASNARRRSRWPNKPRSRVPTRCRSRRSASTTCRPSV